MTAAKIRNRLDLLFKYIRRHLGGALSSILVALFFLWCALLLLVQFPVLQTRLLAYATSELSEATGFPTSVQRLHLDFFGDVHLKGVQVIDRRGVPMIRVADLRVDWRINTLLQGKDIVLEEAALDSVDVRLYNGKTTNISDWIDMLRNLGGPSQDTTLTDDRFVIQAISLTRGRFLMDDPEQPRRPAGEFDPFHLHFEDLSLRASNFRTVRDTIALDIRHMRGREVRAGFTVDRLDTDFAISRTLMDFRNLHLQVGKSLVRNRLKFHYARYKDFSAGFFDLVRLEGDLYRSILHYEDLRTFLPFLKRWGEDRLIVDAHIDGPISDMRVKAHRLQFGSGSWVQGDMHLLHLPDADRLHMDLKLDKGFTFAEDLLQYAPESSHWVLFKLGPTALSDFSYQGTLDEFRVSTQMRTALGELRPDMGVHMSQELFRGTVATKGFHMGQLLDQPLVQQMDADLRIDGSGFGLDHLVVDLSGQMSRLSVGGYPYQRVSLDRMHYDPEQLEVSGSVDDPALSLSTELGFYFPQRLATGHASLQAHDMRALGWTSMPVGYHTQADWELNGLDLDEVVGELTLDDNLVRYRGKEIALQQMRLSKYNHLVDETTNVTFESELCNLKARGYYRFNTLLQDLSSWIEELQMGAVADDASARDYYAAKKGLHPAASYEADLLFENVNLNKLVALFDSSFYLAPGAYLSGAFSAGQEYSFALAAGADSLAWDRYAMVGGELELSLEKHRDSLHFQTRASLLSERQHWGKLATKDFQLQLFHDKGAEYTLEGYVFEPMQGDRIELKTHIQAYADSVLFNFPYSKFRLMGREWGNDWEKLNQVVLRGSELEFRDVGFISDGGWVALQGFVSPDSAKKLEVSVQDLQMDLFNHLLDRKMGGTLSLDASFQDLYRTPLALGKGQVDSLQVDGVYLGDLEFSSTWDESRKLDMQAGLRQAGKRIVYFSGDYIPSAPLDRQLDMRLILDGASMHLLQPLLSGITSEMQGTIIGLVSIQGNPAQPRLRGDAYVADGSFKVDYTQAVYHFSDRILVRPDGIYVRGLRLADELDNYATVDGGLYFEDWDRMRLDLQGQLKNFLVMRTTAKDNDLFYGTLIGSGRMRIHGPLDGDITIEAEARTERNTRCFIPLESQVSTEEKGYIAYVDSRLQDSTRVQARKQFDTGSNLKMDFDIEITPDAYCEMIFNKQTGDIIRGNGKGRVQMNIDTNGGFSMFGQVEVVRGAYNFTMSLADFNLVDKRFNIKPNSFITWSGDPYAANLNITASYEQRASLLPLLGNLDETQRSLPELRKRYPVNVDLKLTGLMTKPSVGFDVGVSQYPSTVVTPTGPVPLESYLAAFRQRLRNDDQELNRQVFSLIVLKQFSSVDRFTGTVDAGGSVGELLSNQFSYWLSQVDENFEIDLNLGGFDKDALQAAQLRLSYTLLNGRLRFTRDGTFTNAQNQAHSNAFLGDWSVEYAITPEGNLRAKVYQRTNSSYVMMPNQANAQMTGASILQTRTFNRFRDIFSRKRRAKTPTIWDINQLLQALPPEERQPAPIEQ